MKAHRNILFTACAGLTVLASAAWITAAIADGIPAANPLSYSGTLEDATGAAITGSKAIRIELYDAVSGGQPKCSIEQTVALLQGRFQIVLPDECAAAARKTPDLWVDVAVDGESLGRTKLAAVPFAVEAGRASAASGALATQVVPAGAVMAFDLAACPAGWTAHADASGRVIVGTSAGLARGAKLGSDTVALSEAQLPAHSHKIVDPGHSHTVNATINYDDYPAFQPGTQGVGKATIASSHSLTGITETVVVGGGQPFDNRQTSLALLYCKKN
jgi:hypothetical protein